MTEKKQRDGNMLRLLLLGVLPVCLCISIYMTLHGGGGNGRPDASSANPSSTDRVPGNFRAASNEAPDANAGAATTDTSKQSAAASGKPSDEIGPAATRANRRDGVVSTSRVRKSVIDPMASWKNPPPWPEGPRMSAEVETSSRKYVNLRPDDVGELPRIYTAAEERIELRVNFPEGNPGEKIFVEIPNGGTFPDTKSFGRVYELPENRTLSFSYTTDDARGYCTIALRHRGHTRSLPIWVGAPPETGS